MVLLSTLPELPTTLFREAVALHVLGYGWVTRVTVCMQPAVEAGSSTPYMYVGTLQQLCLLKI